jgi:hypothetical protein
MLIINFSILWSFSYFFFFFYNIIVLSIILYSIPTTRDLVNFFYFKKTNTFEYLNGFDIYWIFLTFLFFFVAINYCWVSYPISSWFGNLLFSSFHKKFFFFIAFFFFLVLASYSSTFYFSSKQVYDFIIICFNFFFWIYFLFLSNNLFTFIFFIEILSSLIFLLLINSTFSATYFYNNLDLNLNNYFSINTPLFYLQSLMYFFWISLITSLNLFFFLILFYIKFLTFDWFIFEFIFF